MHKTKIFIQTSCGVLSLREIAERTGIRIEIIKGRYYSGWRGDDLLKPIQRGNDKIPFRGQLKTPLELSQLYGIPVHDISLRFRRGWRGEDLIKPIKRSHAVGERFGMLTIQRLYRDDTGKKKAVCICDCGNTCTRLLSNLVKRGSLYNSNCGCSHKTTSTHGMSKSREHRIWRKIKGRCYNPNSPDYANYGGRGIVMSESWRESFEAFYKDMGPIPQGDYSIDRIDVNAGYCKENCRWATRKEQNRNKRNTLFISYRGENRPLAEWGELLNIPAGTIRRKLYEGKDITLFFDERKKSST